MLHPINTLTAFEWSNVRGIFVKWRNCLKRKGREKWSPTLNYSLLKIVALKGFIFNWHWATTHQADFNPIWNAEALPELLFSKKFNGLLRICASDIFSWLDTLLALTSRVGKSNTPSWWHFEAMGRVRPTRHNDWTLESNHSTLILISSTSVVQGPACTGLRTIARRSTWSSLQG